MIVYDITDKESFNAVKQWSEEVKKYAQSDVKTILVGNKSDLEDRRAVSFNEGK